MNAALLATMLLAGACASTRNADDSPVVAVVNNQSITYNELKSQFNQNSFRETAEEDQAEALREFLSLYTDYKVKLQAAMDAGYMQDAGLLDELKQYETQTAYPYWMENRIKEQLLNDYIARADEEIHATHILIALSENASPADTLQAWNKIMEARAKAVAGEDFDSLSTVYSSMQQGRSMGGDLGYFSVGWAVKPFEDGAYATAVGEISPPVRSRFGYHLIKVLDRRQSTPDRMVSHIFIGSTQDEAAIAEATERANEVYKKLEEGQPFMELAIEFSEDGQSGPMGGQIGWINHGRYLATFTEPVMSHPTDGSYSEPFYSGYGVHIIKIDSVRTYPSDEAKRADMLTRLQQLPHYRDSKVATIAQARRVAGESKNAAVLDEVETMITSNRARGFSALEWPNSLSTKTVYSVAGKSYSASDYIDWVKTQVDTTSTGNYNFGLRDKFFTAKVEDNIIDITKKEFPAFADLSTNYLNGLAIFKISEDSVWNYAKSDSAAVQALFEQQSENYVFDTRYVYHRITASSDSLLQVSRQLILDGVVPDSLRGLVQGVIVREDVVNALEGEPHDQLIGVDVGGFSDVFTFRGRPTILYLKAIEPSRPMTFEEAYFRVVTDYQPIRERRWLDDLRETYKAVEYPERIQ